MLQQKNPLQTLNYIRVGSVVTPIDKDSGIITFISRRFYTIVLILTSNTCSVIL